MLRSVARRPKLVPMSSTSRRHHTAIGHAACIVALLAACGEQLVEDVPTDVCASGKRWVGELTASDEMFPGYDCVGCHRALDGPQLMAAGTVYGLPDADGSRTVQDFCFGVEGAQVTITTADGEVLQTRTNRAGNFYFESKDIDIALPYQTTLRFWNEGKSVEIDMFTQPYYGGCARCHSDREVAARGGTTPRGVDVDFNPDWVAPAGSVIAPFGLFD